MTNETLSLDDILKAESSYSGDGKRQIRIFKVSDDAEYIDVRDVQWIFERGRISDGIARFWDNVVICAMLAFIEEVGESFWLQTWLFEDNESDV